MDILYLGQSSFKIKGKEATLIADPFNPKLLGLKFPSIEANIITISHDHPDHNFLGQIEGNPVVINGPGEYEIKGVKIYGLKTFHDDKNGEERGINTIYQINMDGINLLHLGDLGHKLKPETIEEIKTPDILFIPVGGFFTINANVATEIIAHLEPKIIIPMHYKTQMGNEYQAKLDELGVFLKSMGKDHLMPQPKLHITRDSIPAENQIIVLE